jgi:hypothetical protein
MNDEKLVVYLYIDCDDKIAHQTKGIQVSTVETGKTLKGRQKVTIIVSKEATAFVQLKYIECAKLGIEPP